jgi:hypothetical protein
VVKSAQVFCGGKFSPARWGDSDCSKVDFGPSAAANCRYFEESCRMIASEIGGFVLHGGRRAERLSAFSGRLVAVVATIGAPRCRPLSDRTVCAGLIGGIALTKGNPQGRTNKTRPFIA